MKIVSFAVANITLVLLSGCVKQSAFGSSDAVATDCAIEVQIGAQLADRPDTDTLVSQWVRIRNDQLSQGQAW